MLPLSICECRENRCGERQALSTCVVQFESNIVQEMFTNTYPVTVSFMKISLAKAVLCLW